MPLPEPSYGNYLIFPPVVQGRAGGNADAGREWLTDHLETDNADVFNSRRDESVWRISLSGITLHPSQIDEWDAFIEAAEGMARPVLFRLNSRRFSIVDHLIGIGDGDETEFQLKKTRSYQGYSKSETIRFPWHSYPPQKLPTGQTILPTEYVRIFVGSSFETAVEIPWLSGWDVSRETGIITFDSAPANGTKIFATCKFMIAVHMQDWMPVASEGGGAYTFGAGATLFEAKGGVI